MTMGEGRDPRQVREMFGGIARRYDLLTHVLSLNLDRGWRRRAAEEVGAAPGERVLDLCGGTGDLSVAVARAARGAVVVCCDFCHPMLRLAGPKLERAGLAEAGLVLEADALRLPLADGSVDAVTVGFGVRNLGDLDAGLREMLRVLRPGGRLVVLEFSTPTAPGLAHLYRLYLRRLLPRLGDRASGRRGPYGYLARTIASWPDAPGLAGRIREAGFAAVGWKLLTGGIVALHTAFKEP
jgi:demethylmenaquinone methyltransferase/2-methoxy-6-polyprenyl-1,4-benzoquinol methylase